MFIGHSVGDAAGLLVAMDEAVCDLLYRSRRQLIGMSYLELTHPDDRANNVSNIGQLKVGGAPGLIRKRYLRPDGSFVPVDVQVSRLAIGADAGRLIGTVRLAPAPEEMPQPKRLWARARDVIDLARERDRSLGGELGGDHAWLILLQIYLAEAEARMIDPTTLCRLTGFPSALTIRWVRALRSNGLIDSDGQGFLQLTRSGFVRIESVLGRS